MRIAINGFGRIGRLFFRQAFNLPDIEIIAINDLGDIKNLAYLLKYDTIYRTYDKKVEVSPSGTSLLVDGREVMFFSQKEPGQLPWRDLAIDLVIESTGVFESFEKSKAHLEAGAKKVLITAPSKDEDGSLGRTVLLGINEEEIGKFNIISNASCTTNAASPVIAILSKTIGIEKAILNTVHSYTATQSLVDGAVKGDDFRRGRAGAQNIVPSTTGAAVSVSKALPELSGKFDGISIRVPSVTGSIIDLTFIAKRDTSVEEINKILNDASKEPTWKEILAVSDEQLVSSDIIGSNLASVVDLKFTKVIGGNLVKVLAWYDNEWGYVTTLIKQAQNLKKTI